MDLPAAIRIYHNDTMGHLPVSLLHSSCRISPDSMFRKSKSSLLVLPVLACHIPYRISLCFLFFHKSRSSLLLPVAEAVPVAVVPAEAEAVPAEAIENEKKIIIAQMANDPKAANKPDAIKEKMATGRLGKFYKENCLVDQAFIKDGNMDVNAYVNATAKKLGGDIKIVEYTHFIKGEGLEKRVDDFAAEVAAAVKG